MSEETARTDASAPTPAVLSPELEAALRTLARTERLLLALDFDGTLAPFVDGPGRARMLPASATALARLGAMPQTWVAYVSGRSLSSLETVTEADADALLIGSHGVEVRLGRDGIDFALSDTESRNLDRLHTALADVVARDDRVRLEVKPAGFGVHTRLVDPKEASDVNSAARRAVSRLGIPVTERDGKDILEFSIRDANKGDGVRRLREMLGATGVLFAGDDVTDEDGFGALQPHRGDVGVKVGAGASLADFRVSGIDDISRLLGLMVRLRGAHTGATAQTK